MKNSYIKNFLDNPAELLIQLRHNRIKYLYHLTNWLQFIRVCLSELSLNHCFSRASSIAYALLLTLIPLVVTAAFMLASITDVNSEQVEKLFSIFLPFAPEVVLSYLSTFFNNARNLRGLGIILLIIVSLSLFSTFEESLNAIWKVNRSRSFFVRLRTFTMVVVYSPILFFASIKFRWALSINIDLDFFMLDIVPTFLMVLAFTFLIWFVPNTKVKFRFAFIGGVISGLLFELERHGFSTYVKYSIQTHAMYGALGILPLFLISLFLVSFFILVGAQVSYVLQNYRPLLRAKRRWDRRVGDYKTYFTFRILFDSIAAFTNKTTPPALEQLSKKYNLTEQQASGIIRWLIHENFLHQIGNMESYVPAQNYAIAPVRDILEKIDNQNRKIPIIPDDFTRDYIDSLMKQLSKSNSDMLDTLTFGEMLIEVENGEKRSARTLAQVK
ncbi:MAG: YihY/virulence factor BrkB family protein [Chitinispirillia bacterium]